MEIANKPHPPRLQLLTPDEAETYVFQKKKTKKPPIKLISQFTVRSVINHICTASS